MRKRKVCWSADRLLVQRLVSLPDLRKLIHVSYADTGNASISDISITFRISWRINLLSPVYGAFLTGEQESITEQKRQIMVQDAC